MPTPPPRLIDRPPHSQFSRESLCHKTHQKTPSLKTTSPKNVKWGVSWHPPTLMILYFLSGTALAITHHFYFSSLHATLAGSSDRQQWATGIGTALSFLVVALLRAATCAAYGQYAWTLVRREGFEMATIDKLFSLTTDPMGFWGGEMWRKAKIGVIVAGMCWITPLAGIAPPATLSVVPGLVVDDVPTSMAALDWNSPAFYDVSSWNSVPSAEVMGIATRSAMGLETLPIVPPAPNSSFSSQFYGPSVQCSPSNTSQQAVMDEYVKKIRRDFNRAVTQTSLEEYLVSISNQTEDMLSGGILSSALGFVAFSAFAPFAGIMGWLWDPFAKNSTVDQMNNWFVNISYAADELNWNGPDEVVQRIFVQTSNESYTCMLGNASYDVHYDFINGIQASVRYTISEFLPLLTKRFAGKPKPLSNEVVQPGPYARGGNTRFELSYMSVWQAFTSQLSGNVTLKYLTFNSTAGEEIWNLTMGESSSRLLLSGLSACDDIVNSHWYDLPLNLEDPYQSPLSFYNFSNLAKLNKPNHLLDKPAWMCRNRTVARGIEDLAANITIGMLTSASLMTQNATVVNVSYQHTKNVYRYDSQFLLASYASAMGLTLLGVMLGLFSFKHNGVAHSTAFSAMIATTRNADLDALLEGNSLGAVPLDDGVGKVKLRFGELVRADRKVYSGGLTRRRVGFGHERDVVGLIKGDAYI